MDNVEAENEAQRKTLNKFSDEEIAHIIKGLEEQFPQYSRLPHWKLIGFQTNKNTGGVKVPIYAKTWYDKSRYTCEKLRELRAQRGVGSSKKRKKESVLTTLT